LLSLTLHLGHNFGSVQQEEESTSFVGDGLSDQGLSRAWGSEKEHTLRRLDTECLEQLRMSQGQFDHLANFGELLANATNVIVANVFSLFFIVAVDGIAFVEERRLRGHNTVLGRVNVDNLELNWTEATTDDEGVALLDGAVAVLEVGDEVGLGDVSCDALNRVGEGKHMNFGCIGHVVRAGVDRDDVSHTHAQVASHDLVHQDVLVVSICLLGDESDAHGLLSLFA